jgi:hypothetical protein
VRGPGGALPRTARQEAGRGFDGPVVVPTAVRPDAGRPARFHDLGIGEVVTRLPSAGLPGVLRLPGDDAPYV